MSDGAFGFLDDCHKKCGDKEFRCSPWRLDDQGLVWDVSFLHPIKIYLGKIDQSTKDECREVFGLWIKLQESSSRPKGASSSSNADDQSGDTVPDVTSAPDEPGVRSPVPPIQGHQRSIGRDSIASTRKNCGVHSRHI